MGLDLSIVKNIKLYKKESECTDDEIDDLHDSKIHLYNNDSAFGQSDGIETGFYYGEYDHSVEHLSWSYSGYSNWRNHLIDFIGFGNIDNLHEQLMIITRDIKIETVLEDKKEEIDIPFVELCYFSDCEGFIGPKTSKKLYEDFVNKRDEFHEFTKKKAEKEGYNDGGVYYTRSYDRFIEHFRIASEENGAIIFH